MLPLEPASPGAPFVSPGAEPVTLPLPWTTLVVPDGVPDVMSEPVLTASLPVDWVEALPSEPVSVPGVC